MNTIRKITIMIGILLLMLTIETEAQERVKINNQVWMTKNLNVSNYRNGDEIYHARTAEDWKRAGEQGIGAWCYYDNAAGLGAIYGKLYNWYAVNDPRGLAPRGWRVPSDDDWQELEDFYGEKNGGAFLKSTGTSLWKEPNEGANNLSGFSALPGGYRFSNGTFTNMGSNAYWWSSTERKAPDAGTPSPGVL